jgi:hypothetical protein
VAETIRTSAEKLSHWSARIVDVSCEAKSGRAPLPRAVLIRERALLLVEVR